MHRPRGVTSNIIVQDGRVYFAQAHRSLTVLDLETGAVIARHLNIDSGESYFQLEDTIWALGDKIIARARGKVTVVQTGNPKPLWQTRAKGEIVADQDRVFLQTTGGPLVCHDVSTGREFWRANLTRGYEFQVIGPYIVAFWKAEEFGMQSFSVLDLETGRVRFQKEAHTSAVYLSATIVEERVLVRSSTCDPERRPYGAALKNAGWERTLVFDLDGAELPALLPDHSEANAARDMRKKAGLIGEILSDDDPYFPDGWRDYVFRHEVAGGVLHIGYLVDPPPDLEETAETYLHFQRGEIDWLSGGPAGYDIGPVVGGNESRIIITSRTERGLMECLDATTGESQWAYLFPISRATVGFWNSYSGHYLDEAPAKFEQAVSAFREIQGYRPSGTKPNAALSITLDPNPELPFDRILSYKLKAWACVMGTLSLLTIVIVGRWKHSWHVNLCAVAFMLITVGANHACYSFWMVSFASRNALLAMMLVSLGASVMFSSVHRRPVPFVCSLVSLWTVQFTYLI